jgi:acyl carrier protein
MTEAIDIEGEKGVARSARLPIEASSQSPIEGTIRAILERIARLEPGFAADADLFRDLGVKSVTALDLLLSLEEELGVVIPDEAFGEARTVQKLVALVQGLQGAA